MSKINNLKQLYEKCTHLHLKLFKLSCFSCNTLKIKTGDSNVCCNFDTLKQKKMQILSF